MIVALILLVAGGYQIVALAAVVTHLFRRDPRPTEFPSISILKPVRGADEALADALESHTVIEYPGAFEVLIGVDSADDPVAKAVPPGFRTVVCRAMAPNAKVAKLEVLAKEARYPILVVNDADITVPRDYLTRLAGVLQQPETGLVTCLYRAGGNTWEALGIATDFAPSALVAPLVGVREFGLGSTLAFRASDLRRIGGFASLRDYIADDYQLGKRISALGLRVRMARMPVATWLGGNAWAHQVRWARTIRLSRGAYYGLPVTNATLWAVLLAALGAFPAAAALLALRIAVGLLCGLAVLRDPVTVRWWWLMPLRDLWAFAVWVAGGIGSTVDWGGNRIRLDRTGRITRSAAPE